MNKTAFLFVALWLCQAVFAQQSGSYQLKEHTLNSGGNPANGAILTSTSFRFTLDAIGDSVSLTGLSSSSFRIDAGFVTPYPPPGETMNLRFSNATTLIWDPEKSAGAYELYRGSLSSLPGGYGSCLQAAIPSQTATDSTVPPPGTAFFFLVTARNNLAEEGTKGFDSAGNQRGNSSPCP